MKNLFLSLAGVAVFILIVGLITKTNRGEQTILSKYLPHFTPAGQTPAPTPAPNLKTITIGNTMISVVIADNDATREKGLGGVTNLPANQGMLFTFASKNITPSFWMKGMQIPLDFIWIGNNKVNEITPNVPAPAPGTPDNELRVYTPTMPIDYVLEVNAGFAATNNIKVGDQMQFGQ